MPLIKSSSDKAFKSNVRAEMHAGKSQKQSLAIAYSTKRRAQAKHMAKGGHVHDKTCMAMGGSCYAEGGEVNEKLHPEHEASPMALVDQGESSEEASEMEADRPSMDTDISLADAVMNDRKRVHRMAEGGEVDAAQPAYETRIDLEPVHTMTDAAHPDQESPSLDDQELVGQILRDRKSRRRS